MAINLLCTVEDRKFSGEMVANEIETNVNNNRDVAKHKTIMKHTLTNQKKEKTNNKKRNLQQQDGATNELPPSG